MDIYKEVSDRIIAQLENGVIPWQKPWIACGNAISHTTGKPYSLLNQMLLGRPGEYLTFAQAQNASSYSQSVKLFAFHLHFLFCLLHISLPQPIINLLNIQAYRFSLGQLHGDMHFFFTPWGSRGREFESRHSDQAKVLDFTKKSSTFSFIFYPKSLEILYRRVHFFKKQIRYNKLRKKKKT